MKSGRKRLYLFLVLGVASIIILWRAPGNKYEWMRTDPVVGSPSARLPADPDSWMPLIVFAIPALIVAILNLTNAVGRLKGPLRVLAILFSLGLVALVTLKFARS